MSETGFIKRLSQNEIDSVVKNKKIISILSMIFSIFGIDLILMKRCKDGVFHLIKTLLLGIAITFLVYFITLLSLYDRELIDNVIYIILYIITIMCGFTIFIDIIKGVLNGIEINKMTDDEFSLYVSNNAISNVEILRYKNNKLSYNACLLAIVFQCIGFVAIYSALTYDAKFNTGVDIIINIIFLLFTFLTAEKVKTYNVTWGILSIVIGVLNSLRIFTYLYSPFSGENLFDPNNIATYRFNAAVLCYVLVLILLVVSGIVSIYRGKKLNAFLNSNNKEVK